MTTKAYFLPQSIREATDLLAEYGPSLLTMAGGTIAMPLINEGISLPEYVMGLRRVGLDYLQIGEGNLHIGATTPLTKMIDQKEVPMLQDAARAVGGWAIRNMGTVGGNLFAPPPSGDFATALLALDAQVKLSQRGGERVIKLEDFYTGFMITALEPGELVTELIVPLNFGKTAFMKFGRRHANTPSIVTAAVNIHLEQNRVRDARLALNGVGPHPLRAKKAENALINKKLDSESIEKASAIAVGECEPFTDAIASEWYRRKMVKVILHRVLDQIVG